MIKEAIVLAGGLGTRLRKVLKDIPKPMALIGDKPFLSYVLSFLKEEGVTRVILAVGYKSDNIINFFGDNYLGLNIVYSFEDENNLLGTGGAIVKASELIKGENFFVLNGDTFFEINLLKMLGIHKSKSADVTIALKPMNNITRYGVVEIDEEGKIINFVEKGVKRGGLINGGIYIISKKFLRCLDLPERFSFEQDLLQRYFKFYKFYGVVFDGYFIDIGVHEDYERAKLELSQRYR